MSSFDEIKNYSKTVCEQIRWKRAHHMVSEEIENHLIDQREAYIIQGEDEKSATKKAVLQMGDAVSIGMGLDKAHKPKPQWKMIILATVLMLIGMFTSYLMTEFTITPYIFSATVFLICYFLDFTILGKYAKQLYFIVLAASIIGLLFSSQISNSVISLSYLSLIFPTIYSILIYYLRNNGLIGIILCGLTYIPFAAVLLLIPSLTGFILFTVSALVILSMSIKKGWFSVGKKPGKLLMLMAGLNGFVFTLFYALQNTFYLRRISIAFNPNIDPYGRGYIPILVRDILANSKFIGPGTIPGTLNSNVTMLPVSSVDYILTTLTHRFGWIIFIGIIGVMIAFSVFGLYYTSKQKSVLGALVSLSIIITFIYQASTYIMSNLGFGLLSSLSLPLVSHGTTALVINSALIGFMLSVFRTGDVIRDSIQAQVRRNPILSYEEGKLIINIKGN